MNTVASWQDALIESWIEVWNSFVSILPTILGAIVIFAVGLVIAYWAKRIVVQLLKAAQLERVSEQAGIDEYLKKAKFKFDFIGLIGIVVEWLIILVFFLAVVDVLGLDVVSVVLTEVLGYIPNVIAAALIFAAGYFVAGLVEGLVRGALASVDHKASETIGHLSRWLLLIVAFFAAVDQLQIAQTFIAVFFQGLTYTVVLAVGLSVGLGAKDLVSRVLNDWYDQVKQK